MVQGKWFAGNEFSAAPLGIRQSVFHQGRDERDEWSQQVVVYEDHDTAVGTARLRWEENAFVIDLLGVLEEKRHRGFGDLLVRLCLFKALTHNGRRVSLSCPESVSGFFARYGFQKERLLSDGQCRMSVSAEDIHLDHCNGHCDGCR